MLVWVWLVRVWLWGLVCAALPCGPLATIPDYRGYPHRDDRGYPHHDDRGYPHRDDRGYPHRDYLRV